MFFVFICIFEKTVEKLFAKRKNIMVLTTQLRRRLNYMETKSTSNSWAKDSTTDYSGIVVSYTVKVIVMLILLCVDLGFNSSVDHDDPLPKGGRASYALTFGMIYFGSQVRGSSMFSCFTSICYFAVECASHGFPYSFCLCCWTFRNGARSFFFQNKKQKQPKK